mgnify:CR=1 FL=1
MNILVYYSNLKVSKSANKNNYCTSRLTHLVQFSNNLTVSNKVKKENHYLVKNILIYPNLIKLDKVLSSNRVYPIHRLSWYRKSLCLELIFALSLNSAIKSLLLTIVILQKNKKEETMIGQKVGYIRVSTIEQNTESQKSLLQDFKLDKVFEEKVSGKNTQRPQLQALLEYVREGDTVYVKDLSRLARNTKDLLDIIECLNNKGVGLFSLKESIDTSSNFGKLMITFLGAIYEFERANLLERQRDGIAVAKKLGKYKGRKQIEKPANFSEVYKKWLNREIKSNVAIRELNISEYAFYKFVREENANG